MGMITMTTMTTTTIMIERKEGWRYWFTKKEKTKGSQKNKEKKDKRKD